jgi:RNA-directed DNA polymerase
MHENRETSETPVAQPGSRSAGEGKSHTACMYVAEESHSGIVPMNHSNNDETPLAESEEGRLLIKENAGQSSTHLTQSREACPRDWRACGKQQRKIRESSLPCSTI